jgi:hypothetical protein
LLVPRLGTASNEESENRTMSMLDLIAAQRQRLTERLARVDGERTKLAEQLGELEAAERALSRLSPSKAAALRRRKRARKAEATKATTRRRGMRVRKAKAAEAVSASSRPQRAVRAKRKAAVKSAVPLGEATLRAIDALGNKVSAEQIRAYLGKKFSMQVRPNHLGRALQRHLVGGRLNQDNARWSMVKPRSNGAMAAS